jgi:signal transduction histidine kinase
MRRNNAPWFFGIRVQLIIAFVIFAAFIVALAGTIFYSAMQRRAIALSRAGEITQTELVLLEDRLATGFWTIVAEQWVALVLVLLAAGIIGAFAGTFFSRSIGSLVKRIQAVEVHRLGSGEVIRSARRQVIDECDTLVTAINDLFARISKQNTKLTEDVEERTLALQHSNETLRDFVYYTAHRLRTPLNVIRWSTNILNAEEKGKLNREQREVLADLERASLSVLELTDDLQDLLIMERKAKMMLHMERASLLDVIDAAAGEVAVLAREHQVEIDWKRPKKGPAHPIFVDRDRFVQALKHLLENAILYNVKGGTVAIKIEFGKQIAPADIRTAQGIPERRGDYYYVSILDTGIGIPAEERAYVFERFFRGKRARTQWTDGGGIGLSVARPVVLLHGGALWFRQREKGSGTTFTASIPVA